MKRRVFFSFHYEKDNWRASQIRNMGILEGNPPISDNDWESIKREGDKAIQNWIESQIKGKTCCIVLIGEETYRRRWINFEIKLAWKMGLGVLGIYIDGLKDCDGNTSKVGANPFSAIRFGSKTLDQIVEAYRPSGEESTSIYNYIKENISNWVETAITIRKAY